MASLQGTSTAVVAPDDCLPTIELAEPVSVEFISWVVMVVASTTVKLLPLPEGGCWAGASKFGNTSEFRESLKGL